MLTSERTEKSQRLRSGIGKYMDKKQMPQISKMSIYSKNMGFILHGWMSRSSLTQP